MRDGIVNFIHPVIVGETKGDRFIGRFFKASDGIYLETDNGNVEVFVPLSNIVSMVINK